MFKTLLLLVVLALGLLVFQQIFPDIQRYLRMRSM